LNEVQAATLFQHARGQVETGVAHRRFEPLTYLPGAGTDLNDQIACFGLANLNYLLRNGTTYSFWQAGPPFKQTGLAVEQLRTRKHEIFSRCFQVRTDATEYSMLDRWATMLGWK